MTAPLRRGARRVGEGAELADAVIAETGARAGCTAVLTFDAKAARRAGMTLVDRST